MYNFKRFFFFEMLRTVASPETFVSAKYVSNLRKLTIITNDSAILWQHFLEMLRTVASPGTKTVTQTAAKIASQEKNVSSTLSL